MHILIIIMTIYRNGVLNVDLHDFAEIKQLTFNMVNGTMIQISSNDACDFSMRTCLIKTRTGIEIDMHKVDTIELE